MHVNFYKRYKQHDPPGQGVQVQQRGWKKEASFKNFLALVHGLCMGIAI